MTLYEFSESLRVMEIVPKSRIRERAKAIRLPIRLLCERAGIPLSTFYDLPEDLGTRHHRYSQLIEVLERAEAEVAPKSAS